ncbi:glycoside hydrolase family 88 protein [Halocatena marina]|uniref:Glycoside hydrolase family 88 protein n=1 Tax=Halocatena marina TaxID=2934937 RepID=A0ABD5YUR5_9EURY
MAQSPSIWEDILERYESCPNVDSEYFETAKQFCLRRIKENTEPFVDHFPSASSEDLSYEASALEGWTPAFWSGILWLAYETTDENVYRSVAESQLPKFANRLETADVISHDLGFLYTLSAIASSMLTDNSASEQMALDAADRLTERYWPDPGIIQAWGDPEDPDATDWGEWAHGRIIADTMMNLPLLFMASIETGDDQYHEIATNHAENAARYLVRDDGSTFHTYKFDVTTGTPLGGETFQGFADDSCWSRGQAWVFYGFALAAGIPTRRHSCRQPSTSRISILNTFPRITFRDGTFAHQKRTMSGTVPPPQSQRVDCSNFPPTSMSEPLSGPCMKAPQKQHSNR